MPKQRPPAPNQTQHCSFCGEHKNKVPLIVTSTIKPQSACCSTCALAIVQQTQVWAYGIFQQAMQMQQAFDQRLSAQAKAAGATPIRVRLPINGRLFKLEKILALPADQLYFETEYSNWEVAQ